MKKLTKNSAFTTCALDGPLLDKIKIDFNDGVVYDQYPFSLDIIKNLETIHFPTHVTFLVGENGTGKSTILEAIAHKAGFGAEGGSRNINFKTGAEKHYSGAQKLAEQLTLSWRQNPKNGYFFRAESFFNLANHIDRLAQEYGGGDMAYAPYGGKSLHELSHGESFLTFLKIVWALVGFLYLMNRRQRFHHSVSYRLW